MPHPVAREANRDDLHGQLGLRKLLLNDRSRTRRLFDLSFSHGKLLLVLAIPGIMGEKAKEQKTANEQEKRPLKTSPPPANDDSSLTSAGMELLVLFAA